ncbi:MAG: guanitoxin biosynthesis PLP-dependent transaminase GntE [Anaerolineales bacterium]
MLTLTKSQALFESAAQLLPQGVTSNFRYWGPKTTRYLQKGKGAHIWDVDGNEYVDYRLGFGPAILGHSDDRVDNAVIEAIREGQVFAMSLPLEQQVAARITSMCPSVEMMRFANSGTEATMHALRLARAYTRREKFIMFEGQYHGMHDHVLFTPMVRNDWMTSNRRSPIAVPVSSGIPEALQQLVIMLPYNDPETLTRVVKQAWHEIATIIVEPVMGNCGALMPEPGWLETIRAVCDEHGIVMLMDEVKTGFRVARGGAQELFGVQADLVTYAKAMGNGYPVAAFGGKREIMQQIGQGVIHGGTYCGNRLSMAAANATLDILQNTTALDTLHERGLELQAMITEILERTGPPFTIVGHPSLFTFWFTERPPKEFRDWLKADHALYEKVIEGMIQRGVLPEPDMREPWFICAALTHADIAKTADALEDSVREVLKSR